MGRPPCCDKSNVKRGLWTAEEDAKILAYVSNHGIGNWTLVPKKAGLNRCGKSCRLRWTNYLRPDLKHDSFTPQEEELIIDLHKAIGSRWSLIAKQLPGRTDNDVKNYWNTKLRKKLQKMGIDPVTHKPFSQILSDFGNISGISSPGNQFSSFSKNLNTNIMANAESCSVLSGPQCSSLIVSPMLEQVQDNSTTANNSTWDFVPQFQVPNNETMQTYFLNDVSSSCSSSSSNKSPQSYSCQQPEAEITHSAFMWSELLNDPVLSMEFQPQQEHEFNGLSSSVSSPTSTENERKLTGGSDDRNFGGVGHEDFGLNDSPAIHGCRASKPAYGCLSSASSFVDGILDMDREMRSQFPDLLDPSFYYQN